VILLDDHIRTCSLGVDAALLHSNSHYETDFGVSSTAGAGNTKIVFFFKPTNGWLEKTDFYNENC